MQVLQNTTVLYYYNSASNKITFRRKTVHIWNVFEDMEAIMKRLRLLIQMPTFSTVMPSFIMQGCICIMYMLHNFISLSKGFIIPFWTCWFLFSSQFILHIPVLWAEEICEFAKENTSTTSLVLDHTGNIFTDQIFIRLF